MKDLEKTINWEDYLRNLHEEVNFLKKAYEEKTKDLAQERSKFETYSHCSFGYFGLAKIFANIMSKMEDDSYRATYDIVTIDGYGEYDRKCQVEELKVSIASANDEGISFPTISFVQEATLILVEGFDMFTSSVCWNKKICSVSGIDKYSYLMKFLNEFVLEQYTREKKLSFEEAMEFANQYVKEYAKDLAILTKK